jgi:hypothetical protein
MALDDDIHTSVVEERVALPDDCHVRPQALDSLDDSAPGFLRRILLT